MSSSVVLNAESNASLRPSSDGLTAGSSLSFRFLFSAFHSFFERRMTILLSFAQVM